MNMTPADIDQILESIGPLDDAISEIVRDADERWIVRIDDIDVQVEFDHDTQRLRLGTEIGVPNASKRSALYEQLLVYNVAGRETGDVVMALTGPNGSVMQLLVLPTAGVTARDLVTSIVNLSARTPFWRALLVSGVERTTEDAAADLTMPHYAIMA